MLLVSELVDGLCAGCVDAATAVTGGLSKRPKSEGDEEEETDDDDDDENDVGAVGDRPPSTF